MPFGICVSEMPPLPPHYILVTLMVLKADFSPPHKRRVSGPTCVWPHPVHDNTNLSRLGCRLTDLQVQGMEPGHRGGHKAHHSNMFMSSILAPQTQMSWGSNLWCLWLSRITIFSIFCSLDLSLSLSFLSWELLCKTAGKNSTALQATNQELFQLLLFLMQPRNWVQVKLY